MFRHGLLYLLWGAAVTAEKWIQFAWDDFHDNILGGYIDKFGKLNPDDADLTFAEVADNEATTVDAEGNTRFGLELIDGTQAQPGEDLLVIKKGVRYCLQPNATGPMLSVFLKRDYQGAVTTARAVPNCSCKLTGATTVQLKCPTHYHKQPLYVEALPVMDAWKTLYVAADARQPPLYHYAWVSEIIVGTPNPQTGVYETFNKDQLFTISSMLQYAVPEYVMMQTPSAELPYQLTTTTTSTRRYIPLPTEAPTTTTVIYPLEQAVYTSAWNAPPSSSAQLTNSEAYTNQQTVYPETQQATQQITVQVTPGAQTYPQAQPLQNTQPVQAHQGESQKQRAPTIAVSNPLHMGDGYVTAITQDAHPHQEAAAENVITSPYAPVPPGYFVLVNANDVPAPEQQPAGQAQIDGTTEEYPPELEADMITDFEPVLQTMAMDGPPMPHATLNVEPLRTRVLQEGDDEIFEGMEEYEESQSKKLLGEEAEEKAVPEEKEEEKEVKKDVLEEKDEERKDEKDEEKKDEKDEEGERDEDNQEEKEEETVKIEKKPEDNVQPLEAPSTEAEASEQSETTEAIEAATTPTPPMTSDAIEPAMEEIIILDSAEVEGLTEDSDVPADAADVTPVVVVVRTPSAWERLTELGLGWPSFFTFPFLGGMTPFVPLGDISRPQSDAETTEESSSSDDDTTAMAEDSAVEAVIPTQEPIRDVGHDGQEHRMIQQRTADVTEMEAFGTTPSNVGSLVNDAFEFFNYVLSDLQMTMNRIFGFTRPAVEIVREGIAQMAAEQDRPTQVPA
eukprot:Blabericola_migrator_1__13490@NODE_97_length_14383_cov_97_669181_g87_i0_p1_GENE_NODE_97_length_14383_cov_97_669181_g87_i0NODE_97_length_14383_cov_97_669181_g87_i0_p1_ORF_typecomplete_len788_score194_67SMC_N/PF02463_19/0_00018Coilin_N/PF15862_5/0_012TFIIF_alpha/PF05793_12/0_11TFIIF_alpha/PF05793_12/7_8e02Nop14/PF04147_12/5_6U79_P34/PF03064_16/18_NODE_97_length_14383_cov_97_669181_g87_i060918454